MAKAEQKRRVLIKSGVIFEGRDLFTGETYVLPEWFAQSLFQSNRGVDADAPQDEDGEDEGDGEGDQPPAPPAPPKPPTRPRG